MLYNDVHNIDNFDIMLHNDAGAHLGFSEGRGPNFRKGESQYKTKKKRI